MEFVKGDRLSVQVQAREWLKGEIAGRDEVKFPELTDSLMDWLERSDLWRAFFRMGAYQFVRNEFTAGRSLNGLVCLAEEAVTRSVLDRRAEALRKKWNQWFEHVGDRDIRLMAMTREDLLVAASERRQRATTENEIARVWEVLADGLDEGETVGDRYKPEQIEQIRLGIKEEVAA